MKQYIVIKFQRYNVYILLFGAEFVLYTITNDIVKYQFVLNFVLLIQSFISKREEIQVLENRRISK